MKAQYKHDCRTTGFAIRERAAVVVIVAIGLIRVGTAASQSPREVAPETFTPSTP